MKKIIKVLTFISTIFAVSFIIYGFRTGLFSSKERLSAFIEGFHGFAPLIFILIQALQVVVPVLPFALGLVVGVLVFGPIWGFIYNYIGICIGSILAFLIGKKYGRPVLNNLFGEKLIEKYKKLTEGNGFTRAFALLIFFPIAPDDFLCYLAGTTDMTLPTFSKIILLGKPLSIFIYSFGLKEIINMILGG